VPTVEAKREPDAFSYSRSEPHCVVHHRHGGRFDLGFPSMAYAALSVLGATDALLHPRTRRI
jgi:hypothetical protein